MTKLYIWEETSRKPGDAQLIGERIDLIRQNNPHGICSTVDYVTDAVDEASPLHPTIEWDDTAAAWSWRNHQARMVMTSIRLVIDGKVDRAPAFVSISIVTDDGVSRGYMATREIQSKDLFDQAIDEAKRQIKALRVRYRAIDALQPVWEVVDQI